MHADVVEQVRISRRYRDTVHPKFWGRITGTSSDQESAEWLAAKFDDLQGSLNIQRERKTRIRVPTWEEVVRNAPALAALHRDRILPLYAPLWRSSA